MIDKNLLDNDTKEEDSIHLLLEKITNDLLNDTRELEYSIQYFGKKCNGVNALNVRKLIKKLTETSKDFSRYSIDAFKK